MRVVHISSDHPALDSRIFYKECRSLARAGYDVTLIAQHPRDTEIDGVRIKGMMTPASRWSAFAIAIGRLWRAAQRTEADIYHLHDPELLPLGLWLQKRGKEVIYDVHDDFPTLASMNSYLPFPGPLRQIPVTTIRAIENFVSPRLSAVIAADETIAARFAALNDNCRMVRNLPEPAEMTPSVWPAWNERSRAVAYVGSFTIWRGLREMVLAMHELPPSLECKLLLVGHIPDQLHHQIAGLPGYDRVQSTGVLDRAGVRQILSTVRAGLAVLHPIPFVLCTWPIKIFEYMAAGIPVIASDLPGWRKIIGDPPCGLLVNPLDPKAIAEAIELVLTQPDEAETMGLRGRQSVVEHYNWSSEEDALLDLYERIATRRRTTTDGDP